MADALQSLCDLLESTIESGAEVCRSQLLAGFSNTEPALVVTMQDDAHHQSRATRDVRFEVRCYGGSGNVADAELVYRDAIAALNNAHDTDLNIERIGEVKGQELPVEPDTGWPSYRIQGRMMLTREA